MRTMVLEDLPTKLCHKNGVSMFVNIPAPWFAYPRSSMYGIFTYTYPINDPNVGVYTIHGAYGIWAMEGSIFNDVAA